MEQTYYMNVLFGKNRQRLFDELMRVIPVNSRTDLKFQVNPYRISPVAELSGNRNSLREDIQRHLQVMADIAASDLDSVSRPFTNTIFVNYTTSELEPALRFERIRYYLCDYIDSSNIEVLTMTSPKYVNFLKKVETRQLTTALNSYFLNYATLTFYDTNADQRIANTTTLDIGDETDDDVTYVLQTRLQNTHIIDDDRQATMMNGGEIILPYHPFRNSLFASIQNIKDNINAILLSRDPRLIYYPFGQAEWLDILQHIRYEHVLLNFLVSPTLYPDEFIQIPSGYFRNSVSYNFRYFRRVQNKHRTHLLNDTVFDYSRTFVNNSKVYAAWLNVETRFQMEAALPFTINVYGRTLTNGLFI